jgi:hypothetical protein
MIVAINTSLDLLNLLFKKKSRYTIPTNIEKKNHSIQTDDLCHYRTIQYIEIKYPSGDFRTQTLVLKHEVNQCNVFFVVRRNGLLLSAVVYIHSFS